MNYRILLLSLAVLVVSCTEDQGTTHCDLSKTLDFETFSMELCGDMIQIPKQGRDTYIGDLMTLDSSLSIHYDIGYLAGFYVEEDHEREVMQAVNHEFWLSEGDDDLTITFPIGFEEYRGIEFVPMNFRTTDKDQKDLVIEIMKTVVIKE